MPRLARLHAPGALVHVIGRFVDREHRLVGSDERRLVLRCLGEAFSRSDWLLIAYALMSSHLHLAAIAGASLPNILLKSLHVRIAMRLNALHGRFGPVFAERATTILAAPSAAIRLVPYIHNNPTRAGVVTDAAQSDWTSHRAWIGRDAAPPWLHVGLGLELAGLDATRRSRRSFAAQVRACAGDPRWAQHGVAELAGVRTAIRRAIDRPVELASPVVDETGSHSLAILHAGATSIRPPWHGDLRVVVRSAALAMRVPTADVCSRSKRPDLVAARRLAGIVAVRRLGRPTREIAAQLGLSSSSMSELLSAMDRVAMLDPVADRIERDVRDGLVLDVA